MSTMRYMFGIAAMITLAACATRDSSADSIRADTISPGPQPEVTAVPAVATAASSTPPATDTAPAKPAPRAPAKRGSKTAEKRDTSNLGYDRAIPAKIDKAHTLPRPTTP